MYDSWLGILEKFSFLLFAKPKKTKTVVSMSKKNIKNVNVTKNVNEDIKQSPKIN